MKKKIALMFLKGFGKLVQLSVPSLPVAFYLRRRDSRGENMSDFAGNLTHTVRMSEKSVKVEFGLLFYWIELRSSCGPLDCT